MQPPALLILALAAVLGTVHASAQTSINPPKGEPTNAAEAAAKKAAADQLLEEKYQAIVAKLPPDQQAWEKV